MAIDHDHGWCSVPLSQFVERLTRRNLELDSNVLTISATRGLVSQRDYFGKQIASENLASYYRLLRGEFAYNKSYSAGYPLGAIKRLDAYDSGVVSPLYICFSLTREDVAFSDYFVQYVEAGRLDENLRSIAAEGARNHGLLNVKPAEFLSLPVTLPPLPEQKKIAAILSVVDETIAKTESVIAQLQIVKKAMMEQLLTKGMPGRHTRFKQTEIGEIPEEWEVVELGSVGEWLSGGTPSKSDPHLWAGSVPWVSPKDMKRPRLGDAEDHVHEDAIGNGTRLVPANTLLMVVRGMILAHTFPVCLTTASVTFNQDIKALRPSVHFEPEFLLYWLQGSQSRVLEITEVANHGTKRIPTEQLHAMGVPLPSLPEQQGIVSAIRSLEVLIGKTMDEKRELQAVKSSLSSSLLSGEIRVASGVA